MKIEVTLDITNTEGAVEEIYDLIKSRVVLGRFKIDNIEALSELITELLNRMKAGEYSGEC